MPYKVFVDDNFHYMDESERYAHGEFPTLGAAIEACQRIVDEYLASAWRPGMQLGELLMSYSSFGEDPWILAVDEKESGVLFSARDYASQRSRAMCSAPSEQSPPGSLPG